MDEPDKLTQTRGSLQVGGSLIRRFYGMLCPCFSPLNQKKQGDRDHMDYFESDLSNRSSSKDYELARKNTLDFTPYMPCKIPNPFIDESNSCSFPKDMSLSKKQASRSFIHSINNSPTKKIRQAARETVDLRQIAKRIVYTEKKNEWYNFPVFKYREGEVVLLGKNNKNLLAEISSVKLQPSPTAVQKQFLSKDNTTLSKECKKLDDFWKSRYFYFEKFDEGIQIDKESLCNLTPEAVSDYIAGKCSDCKTVVDAFSGVGHNATKMGTICEKVICVEEEAKKYNFLINNAKCYEIYNLELFMKPFLDIQLKQKVDVVLLHPQMLHTDYLYSSMCEVKHFKPNLSLVIKKALQVANNLVLLLPPNINIKEICYQISKSSQQLQQKMPCSCSVKIEKIYFRGKLSYLAVFFGWNVQQEIKINAELGFIYKVLKDPMERGFGYKKLLKYLRQKYGIIKLLNLVSQSRSLQRPGKSQIQKLIELVRHRKLILEHKLQSLLIEQKSTPRKALTRQNTTSDEMSSQQSTPPDFRRINEPYTFEQQKQRIQQEEGQQEEGQYQDEENQTITERTQSFYSNGSGMTAFRKRATIAITESGRKTENQKNAGSDINIERESNASSIVVNKIIDDSSSLDKDSKSPPSPTHTPHQILKSMLTNKTTNFSEHTNYRHTMNYKKMQNELFMTNKQNLKRTLIHK